jgi:hypothetical protein
MTEAVASPKTDAIAPLRPCPRQRDRMKKIEGPGVMLRAIAVAMNSVIV